MAKWLDKYEQGGMVLKQKTHDNYGKKPNPNDVQMSAGPGFVGEGYNIKGRDYSPAWGGSFAQNGIKVSDKEKVLVHDPQDYEGGHMYALKKTVTPYKTNQKIKKYTKDATNPEDIDFLHNYRHTAGSDDNKNAIAVPYEGDRHWNIDRFITDPAFGKNYPNLKSDDDSIEAERRNVLADMFKYQMFQNPEQSRGKSFREAKRFVRNEIDSRVDGPYFQNYMREGVYPVGTDGVTTFTNHNPFFEAWESLQGGETPTNKNYRKNPWDETKTEEVAKDYLKNTKKLSRKETREQIKKWKNESKSMIDDYYKPSDTPQKTGIEPMREYAMGGGLPGAVGFTYARTQDPAPSNGKYAKKTKASAQNGELLSKYDNISNANSLKKEAEERLITMGKPKSTISQYTPKPGEQEQWNKEKLQRIQEESAPLNKMAASKGATNMQDAALFATDVMTLGEGTLALKGLAKPVIKALGKKLSSIPTSSRYITELENLGHVQTSGINKRAVQMMMGKEPRASNVLGRETQAVGNEAQTLGTQARYQRLTSYEPPTDAELAAMNEADASRYFRRPDQEARRPVGISQDEIENYLARDPQARSAAQAATNDLRAEASSNVNMDAVVHRNNPIITERRLAGRQNSLRASGFTDAEIAADEAALRRGDPVRTPSQIRGGGTSTYEQYRNRVEDPMKEWNPKEFRIGEGYESGITKMKHPDGQIIKQDVKISQDVDGTTWRNYEVSDEASSSKYIKVSTTQDPGDAYTDVNDISFFNRDPKSSSKQMNIVFSHLPTKARIAPINTSMHSQPLLDMRMAKLNSGQPGRIQIKPEYMDALNKITREEAAKPIHWYDEAVEQFPKLQKSTNALNEYTGAGLKEPFIKYKGSPISFEEFKTPEMRKLFENPQTSRQLMEEVEIMVNKYKTIKNWKNGGQIVDSMGQWANPGEVTTIPSNDITMRGVNYDVMGVSNTGDKKLMKPGKNYKLGTTFVPKQETGGWLNKYK